MNKLQTLPFGVLAAKAKNERSQLLLDVIVILRLPWSTWPSLDGVVVHANKLSHIMRATVRLRRAVVNT